VRERLASVDGALSTAGTVDAGEETVNHVALRELEVDWRVVWAREYCWTCDYIVSLCITSIVSDFGLIVIVRGLHCVNYCLTVRHCLRMPGRASRFYYCFVILFG